MGNHMKVAQYWDSVNNVISLTLIFFSTVTTIMATLGTLPALATALVSGVTTLLSAVVGFLQPAKRRQEQAEASSEFRALMMQMIRCENDKDYEDLWKTYNKEILREPFLPKKFASKANTEYSMTPELMILIDKKEDMVEAALNDEDDDDKNDDNNSEGESPQVDDGE